MRPVFISILKHKQTGGEIILGVYSCKVEAHQTIEKAIAEKGNDYSFIIEQSKFFDNVKKVN